MSECVQVAPSLLTRILQVQIKGGMFISHAGMNIPIVPGGAVSKAPQN